MFGTDHTADLARIEAKLDLILKHLGIEMKHPAWTQEVQALIESGEAIRAVRRVREETGLGLKEANALVDGMKRGVPPPLEF